MISIKEITPSYVRNKISSIKNDMLTDKYIMIYKTQQISLIKQFSPSKFVI